jgi:hypothetical protein
MTLTRVRGAFVFEAVVAASRLRWNMLSPRYVFALPSNADYLDINAIESLAPNAASSARSRLSPSRYGNPGGRVTQGNVRSSSSDRRTLVLALQLLLF